ncbi:MAG TPA: flagellar FliJ family protein [Kofleriaceae bacterium]|nr:flagellar FliJ family protein [Kofleriaceae bacterium]
MTQKKKALTRLRDARGKLRDLEAARTAQAAATCDQRERQLAGASRDLVSAVQQACDQMARARGIADLESVHDDLNAARGTVENARQSVQAAEASRRAAAQVLGQRERELRTTERALDIVSTAERRDGDRREQRMVDDLVGARVSRREI